ncbi:DsrE family protein [Thiocystis violacea]|uniref:DsrE family protein n=1 Tax=Thiocystis violacea TaxID=13725 RepID=UPI001907EDF2|nr:DsrE family protein [Thiocystis violacea]MBK1723272.1 DsrE/DsrF-like family protein [Thiocystis violacea]
MKSISTLMLAVIIATSLAAGPAFAGEMDPLFVNLTTDDSHRARMAMNFGQNQLKRGHPLTIFLNDRGVFLASTANAAKFADQQKGLEAIMESGGTVIVCPMCMKHYEVSESDLLPGLKVGNADLTGGALFQDGTKTLSW